MKNDSNRSYDTHSFTWSHFSRPTIITLNVYTFVDSGKATFFFRIVFRKLWLRQRRHQTVYSSLYRLILCLFFFFFLLLIFLWLVVLSCVTLWIVDLTVPHGTKVANVLEMRKRIFITQSWNRIAWNAHRFSHTHRNGKRIDAENDIGNTVHNINFVDYHKFTFMGQLCSRWQLNMKRHRMRKTETTTETEMELSMSESEYIEMK